MRHNLSHLRPHIDAAETIFLQRELEQIELREKDVKYAELKGRSMIGTGDLIDPGAETHVIRIRDFKGAPALVSDFATDLPLGTAIRSEESRKMKSYGEAYSWSIQEVKAANLARRPLESDRAEAVRRGMAQKLEGIIAIGDTAAGSLGLLSQAGTQTYSTPSTGTGTNDVAGGGDGSDTRFLNKTADQMLLDLFEMVDAIPNNTSDVENANRLILPPQAFRVASRTPRTTTDSKSVLDYFKECRPGVLITSWTKCSTAGSGGVSRAVAFNDATDNVRLLLAFDFETLAPQQVNGAFKVNAYMRTGGVALYFPKSMIYADGV